MAFLFVVGVYGIVALGLLWVIEGFTVKKWQFLAWLLPAKKQRESEPTERDREPTNIAAYELECSETPQ